MRRALYPGTFDPITNGHLDILHRACQLFDEVIVAVAENRRKAPTFPIGERIALVQDNLGELPARVVSFEGLVVDFAREQGAIALIRGIRAVSDFEFEFQMTQMNRDLDPEIETIFLMPGARYFFTSSSLVKQISEIEPERIGKFVPANVLAALERNLRG
ncbi:MAG: pantetheine-phosphate adenylyltransferase [Verrucomicrobiota bacterium]